MGIPIPLKDYMSVSHVTHSHYCKNVIMCLSAPPFLMKDTGLQWPHVLCIVLFLFHVITNVLGPITKLCKMGKAILKKD